MKLNKLYHVYVSEKPHYDNWYNNPAKSFPCHLVTKQMPIEWRGDSGCKYHINVFYKGPNSCGGGMKYYTCSETKLFLYTLWLRIKGFKKDEDRSW